MKRMAIQNPRTLRVGQNRLEIKLKIKNAKIYQAEIRCDARQNIMVHHVDYSLNGLLCLCAYKRHACVERLNHLPNFCKISTVQGRDPDACHSQLKRVGGSAFFLHESTQRSATFPPNLTRSLIRSDVHPFARFYLTLTRLLTIGSSSVANERFGY